MGLRTLKMDVCDLSLESIASVLKAKTQLLTMHCFWLKSPPLALATVTMGPQATNTRLELSEASILKEPRPKPGLT